MSAELDLGSLAALDCAATPGLLYVPATDDNVCCSATAVATKPNTSNDDYLTRSTFHGVVAATYLRHPDYVMPTDDRGRENAELIAAVRAASPGLLRLARRGAASEQC